MASWQQDYSDSPAVEFRGPHRHMSVILDGLIAAFALAALAWVFAVQPVLVHHHTPLAVRLVLTAYPSMSIFLVVITLKIALNPEQAHVPAYWFLVFAMSCMFIGDAIYMFADINVIHLPDRLLDLPYGLAYLGAGVTALHPSMRTLTGVGRQLRITTSRGRVVLVAAALLIPAIRYSPAQRVGWQPYCPVHHHPRPDGNDDPPNYPSPLHSRTLRGTSGLPGNA